MEDAGTITTSIHPRDGNIHTQIGPDARNAQVPPDPLQTIMNRDEPVKIVAAQQSHPVVVGEEPVVNGTSVFQSSGPDIVLGENLPVVDARDDKFSGHQSPTANPSTNTPQQASTTRPLSPGSATAQPSHLMPENQPREMHNMDKKPQRETRTQSTAQSRTKPSSKEEHGGGCRCIVM